jgi:hypothetical protein
MHILLFYPKNSKTKNFKKKHNILSLGIDKSTICGKIYTPTFLGRHRLAAFAEL